MGIDFFNIKSGCVGKLMRGSMDNRVDNACVSRKGPRRESIRRYVRISVPLFLMLFAAIISVEEPKNRLGLKSWRIKEKENNDVSNMWDFRE
jgi:hypothetical protein